VPLVICGRPELHTRYQISSHADLFPSVFDWMQLTSAMPFMTGKALEQYDRSRDFALLRKPVTSADASDFFAIFLPHLRVSYRQLDPLRVLWAQDELGRPVPFSAQVQAEVSSALALAMTGAQLSSP